MKKFAISVMAAVMTIGALLANNSIKAEATSNVVWTDNMANTVAALKEMPCNGHGVVIYSGKLIMVGYNYNYITPDWATRRGYDPELLEGRTGFAICREVIRF